MRNMCRSFERLELNIGFNYIKQKTHAMSLLNDYRIQNRLNGRLKHNLWVENRSKQKIASKYLQLNFVKGLINRFYSKWHINNFKEYRDPKSKNTTWQLPGTDFVSLKQHRERNLKNSFML